MKLHIDFFEIDVLTQTVERETGTYVGKRL